MAENYVDANPWSWVIGGVTFEEGFLKDLKVSTEVAAGIAPEFELTSENTFDELFIKYGEEISRLGNQYVGDKLAAGIDGRPVAQTVNDVTFTPIAPAVFYTAGAASSYGTTVYNIVRPSNSKFMGNFLLKRAGMQLNLTVTSPSGGTEVFSILLSDNIEDYAVTTVGRLSIVDDQDPYPVDSPSRGLYRAIQIRLNNGSLSTNSVPIPRYTFALTVQEGTSIRPAQLLKFCYDNYTSAQIVSATIDSDTNAPETWVYISGVPRLPPGATLGFTLVGRYFIKLFYNLTQLWRVSGAGIVEKVRAPSSDIVEAAYLAPSDELTDESTLVIGADSYVASLAAALSVRLYNSSGVYDQSTPTISLLRLGDSAEVTALSVDTRSQVAGAESSQRCTSGLGQYPATDYGDTYVSTQSLALNEELQLLGGLYTYPLLDYTATSPAGPDYSGVDIRDTTYSEFRWATFDADIGGGGDPRYISRALITIAGITGNFVDLVTAGSIKVYLRFDCIGYWLSATDGYDVIAGGEFTEDGNGIAEYGIYDDSIVDGDYLLPVTLGLSRLVENVYIRVGLAYNVDAISFTSATLTVVSE